MELIGYQLIEVETGNVIQEWRGGFVNGNVVRETVPNTIVLPNGNIVCAPDVAANYNGYMLTELFVEPPVIIPVISDRQFFQQAAIAGMITQEEALAAVKTGAVPAILQAIIDQIQDPVQNFAATMLISGATEFERTHPMVSLIGAALNMTTEQIDAFFLAASLL